MGKELPAVKAYHLTSKELAGVAGVAYLPRKSVIEFIKLWL